MPSSASKLAANPLARYGVITPYTNWNSYPMLTTVSRLSQRKANRPSRSSEMAWGRFTA
jgi:hypothetical protein